MCAAVLHFAPVDFDLNFVDRVICRQVDVANDERFGHQGDSDFRRSAQFHLRPWLAIFKWQVPGLSRHEEGIAWRRDSRGKENGSSDLPGWPCLLAFVQGYLELKMPLIVRHRCESIVRRMHQC